MRAVIFIIALAALWMFLGTSLQWTSALVGLALASMLYFFFCRQLLGPALSVGRGWRDPIQGIRGVILYVYDIVVANFRVALKLVVFWKPVSPAIVGVRLGELRDFETTMLANSITLTPGTISLDFSPNGEWLYVHCLHAESAEAAKRDIERYIETHFGTRGLGWRMFS